MSGSSQILGRRGLSGRLVVASHNEGKVREIAALLAPLGIVPVSAASLGLPEPEEIETSFAGNARLKAEVAAAATGLPALADDSGLEVTALGGAPGVYSARWAGPARDFAMAMRRVRDDLAGAPDRSARFICALALCADGATHVFEGDVHGAITWPPRGDKGFGYDPIFVPEGRTQTFAEMDPEMKQSMTHRARAFAKLVEALS